MPDTPSFHNLIPYSITVGTVFGLSVVAAILLAATADLSMISSRVITDPTALRANLSGIQSVTFFLHVVLNNALIALMVMMSTVFRKKFIPHLFIFWNGFVLTTYSLTIAQAIGWFQFLSAFMPHAVIEIPSLLIAAVFATHAIDRLNVENTSWRIERGSARQYLFIPYFYRVVPFVIVAAAVETFISLPVLKVLVGV